MYAWCLAAIVMSYARCYFDYLKQFFPLYINIGGVWSEMCNM